ncbi:zinc finger protein weckle-like isoform X2 [Drosophila innubila]|nr:zinc finger protein weckle-like isoform X2 [Drosophila innubila]
MSEQNENPIIESHWLNWCRLCAKDDVRGNVKVYTSENANTWNSVLVMAIRKYFDVHMRLEDELSGVLCKECYTLISELIDFAEHVNKVQAIFEILRQSEPSKPLDVEALRLQYGLREGDWTHIIKPVLEIENNITKQEDSQELLDVPKQEFIDLGESIESEPPRKLPHLDESIVTHLPLEEIIIAGWDAQKDAQNDPIKGLRGRRKACKFSNKKRSTKQKGKIEADVGQKVENIESDNDKPSLDADLEFLPASPTTSVVESEFHPGSSSGNESEDIKTENDDLDCSRKRRKLKCKWCTKVYLNPGSYQKHLRQGCRKIEQRTKVDKNLYCGLCDKTLSSASALKLHMEGMHENFKPFVCDHCGKQVKTITALNEHLLVHTDDRPFVCPICRAGFKNKARLKVHCQIHTDPNYVCNICGKKLQTRRTWNMHKLVHSEDRKFKCDVCDALFKRSKTLKKHLLSHTGLRPYVCNYCGKTFACNANCRTHKLKKHPHELKKEENGALTSRLTLPTLEELRVM